METAALFLVLLPGPPEESPDVLVPKDLPFYKEFAKLSAAERLKVYPTLSDGERRFIVAFFVRHYGKQDGTDLGLIALGLKDESRLIRGYAIHKLRKAEETYQQYLPVLAARLLVGDNSLERTLPAWELGNAEAVSKELLPLLLRAAADKEDEIREHALATLAYYQGFPRAVIPVFLKALEEEKVSFRLAAVRGLAAFPKERETLQCLLKALHDSDVTIRLAAASGFRHFPDQASHALPVLVAALQNEDEMVRDRAVAVLGELGPAAAGCVPSVGGLLLNHNLETAVRRSCADALAALGPAAGEAVPVLRKAFWDDPEKTVRSHAARALGKIGSKALGVTLDLAQGLSDDAARVRYRSSLALVDLGPGAAPHLIKGLSAESAKVRKAAARACWLLSKDMKAAVPHLAAALEDPDGEVRREAERALEAIDPEGRWRKK